MGHWRHRRRLYNRRSELAAATDRYVYAYDAENRLVSACPVAPSNGALAVENRYDHRSRRIRKVVKVYQDGEWLQSAAHTFVLDGSNIVLEKVEFANDTIRTFEYFWGADKSGTEQGAGGVGGLLAVSVDGVFYIPCYDHNGNIVLYVSETGSIAAQYVYDPYGNVEETYGNLAEAFSFGFSTKYHDRETGMVGYQRRFYRPDLGRWLNRDPIEEEGGENLYAFCANNPILYYDILGEVHWMTVIQGAIQVASGIMMGIASGGSLIGTGGMSTPIALGLATWASMTIVSGIEAVQAGLNEQGPPDAVQVQIVQAAYETVTGSPMGDTGKTITRVGYYSIDIVCNCYSIHYAWKTYFTSRSNFIPNYGAEQTLYTPSGIAVQKTTSEMRFIGSRIGLGAQSTSTTIDFYSTFTDIYQLIYEADSIDNPDLSNGGVRNE